MRARAICVARRFSRSIWVRLKPDVRPENNARKTMAAIAVAHIVSTRVKARCAKRGAFRLPGETQAGWLVNRSFIRRLGIYPSFVDHLRVSIAFPSQARFLSHQ